jgi:3',5'-cyclic AMP phosphodiesterase CpdA
MNEITIKRQKPDYVTIVHLSDFHFVPDGSEPRFKANPEIESGWEGLIQDIADQNPDLVCVTGDIVDNPFSDLIKNASSDNMLVNALRGKEPELKDWSDSLEATFTSALGILKLICKRSGIDPNKSLFVVPGNHDYRIQGFLKESSFMGDKFSAIIEQEPRTLFNKVFKKYFRSQRILFNSTVQSASDADSIILSLVGFDSLAVDRVINFATGAISLEEYKKFDFFAQKMKNNKDAGQPEFRVSLVHHHPLPVIPTEYFRQSSSKNMKNTSKGLIKVLTEMFEAEQGTLFKNAGSFLYGALKSGVDLILHGHQHHSWFTIVRYPVVDGEHRLLVAGAASIGVITNGKCKYNLIRLYRNGNITVEERSREHNLPDYKGEERLRLYTDSELRLVRNAQVKKRLKDRHIKGYPELKYNIAQADQILRRTEIRQDGSVDYNATFTNLRATNENVPWLIITSHYSQGVYAERPSVIPIGEHYEIGIVKKPSDDNQSSVWGISFSPALSKDCPVTLSITYRMFNVFEFVEEFRRARSTEEESSTEEVVGYTARTIIPDRLVQTVSFPEEWIPPRAPKLLVKNESNRPDDDEQTYHEKSLDYIKEKGVVSISVDLPIPGYWYKLKWPLDSRAKYEKNRYNSDLRNISRTLSCVSLSEKEAATRVILKKLYDKFSTNKKKMSHPLFGKRTELSIFITKYRPKVKYDKKAIEIVLERLAFFGPDDSPLIKICEHKGGNGLIGLAYRSGKTQTVHQGDDMVGYEVDTRNPIEHEALWCVPLKVPSPPEIDDSKSPVYAVLCAGSFENDGSLDKSSPLFREFEEYVKTEINENICNILLEV